MSAARSGLALIEIGTLVRLCVPLEPTPERRRDALESHPWGMDGSQGAGKIDIAEFDNVKSTTAFLAVDRELRQQGYAAGCKRSLRHEAYLLFMWFKANIQRALRAPHAVPCGRGRSQTIAEWH